MNRRAFFIFAVLAVISSLADRGASSGAANLTP